MHTTTKPKTALFMLNIPAEFLYTGKTDKEVAVLASQYSNGVIGVDFLNVDTNLLMMVKVPWMKLFLLAKELAVHHFPKIERPDNFSIMDIAIEHAEKLKMETI
jgi:hypothetical protein